MATLELTETYKRSATFNPLWQRMYSRTFTIVTDNPLDDARTVAISSDPVTGLALPNIGNSFFASATSKDTGSFVQNVHLECVSEDGCQWLATVSYGPYDPTQEPKNPLDRPLHISWGFAEFQKKAYFDIDGNAIVNSVGEAFIPAPEIDDSRPLLRIQRNEATYSPSFALKYKDAINNDHFFDGDPFTWKCKAIDGELQWNQDIGWYYSVTYEFEYNPDTWIQKYLDAGLREFDYSTGGGEFLDEPSGVKPIVPTDLNGKPTGPPVTDPVFLDGNGSALVPGSGDPPVFLPFHVFKEQAFADLNLDPKGAPGQGNSDA